MGRHELQIGCLVTIFGIGEIPLKAQEQEFLHWEPVITPNLMLGAAYIGGKYQNIEI